MFTSFYFLLMSISSKSIFEDCISWLTMMMLMICRIIYSYRINWILLVPPGVLTNRSPIAYQITLGNIPCWNIFSPVFNCCVRPNISKITYITLAVAVSLASKPRNSNFNPSVFLLPLSPAYSDSKHSVLLPVMHRPNQNGLTFTQNWTLNIGNIAITPFLVRIISYGKCALVLSVSRRISLMGVTTRFPVQTNEREFSSLQFFAEFYSMKEFFSAFIHNT